MQLVLCRFGVEVNPGESFHVIRCVEVVVFQLGLKVVQQVGVGRFAQDRAVVIRLERLLDVLGLVREVDNRRFLLVRRVNTVQP